MTVYAPPGTADSIVDVHPRYENFIGGKWVAPRAGEYMDDLTPVTGKLICQVPKSDASDVEDALDAAHEAFVTWGKTTLTERAAVLNKIADLIDMHREELAVAETW